MALKLDLKALPYYFLTVSSTSERRKHMVQFLTDCGVSFKEVHPLIDENISNLQSGATGHARMLEMGMRDQCSRKPFQPFCVLEDDVNLFEKHRHAQSVATKLPILNMTSVVEVPEDTDVLYVGISDCGMTRGNWGIGTVITSVTKPPFTNTVVRVHNMLSSHAYVVCSPAGALALQRALGHAVQYNLPWDIPMAEMQLYTRAYALRVPIFYQDGTLGGQERQTMRAFTKLNNPTVSVIEELVFRAAPSMPFKMMPFLHNRRIIYLKIAKTGGTSIVSLLKKNFGNDVMHIYSGKHEISAEEVEKSKAIVIYTRSAIQSFKEKYPVTYVEACKLVVFRDVFKKALSGYNYQGYEKPFKEVLTARPEVTAENYNIMNESNHAFIHFDLPQCIAIDIPLELFRTIQNIPENISSYYVADFEDLENDIRRIFTTLELSHVNLGFENRTNYRKSFLTSEEKELVQKYFAEDHCVYQMIARRKNV